MLNILLKTICGVYYLVYHHKKNIALTIFPPVYLNFFKKCSKYLMYIINDRF